MLKDGVLNVYWTQASNNMHAGPNIMQEVLPNNDLLPTEINF